MNKGFLFVICFLLADLSDTQRKIVREGEFDVECYVSLKPMNGYESDKMYYWFKGGEIHKSIASSEGLVLHDQYSKYYRTRQLFEKGEFYFGLKNGEWITWYRNGQLRTYTEWRKGYKHGVYISYDEDGLPLESGSYKKDKKSQFWINHRENDTTFHKNDSMYSVKPKSKFETVFNSIFKKRDSIEKAQLKFEKQRNREIDSIRKIQNKQQAENKKKRKD